MSNSLGPGTAVTSSSQSYTGGQFTTNEIGSGNSIVGYNLGYDKNGTPRGTVFSTDKHGKITFITDPRGKTTTTTTSKGTSTATVTDPTVDRTTANEFATVAPPTTVDYGINDAQSTTTSPGDVDDVTSPEYPFGPGDSSTDAMIYQLIIVIIVTLVTLVLIALLIMVTILILLIVRVVVQLMEITSSKPYIYVQQDL